MDNFNLDINNYSCNDLIDLLALPKNYTKENVSIAKEKLHKKLLKMNSPDLLKIQELLLFLDNAENKLFQELINENVLNGTYQDPINNVSFYGSHTLINNNNEIQGKKANTWDGRNVDTYDYPPGFLNPINIKSIKRSINIDTKFRPDYYSTKSSDFTFTLPEKLNKVVSMRLSSIEIPMSFYALSESLENTTFTITITFKDKIEKKFVIKLPSGNYEDKWIDSTRSAYIEYAVNSALNNIGLGNDQEEKDAALENLDLETNKYQLPYIKFTVDLISGRSVFNLSSQQENSNLLNIKLNFNVNNSGDINNTTSLLFRLGWQLGFRAGEYNFDLESSEGLIISEGVCFVNGPEYCYIVVNDYNNSSNNFFRAAFAESILSPNILGRINLTKNYQTNNVYKSCQDDNYNDSLNRTREYFGPVDIQRLSVQILDEYGRVLDLNNMDWSFVLSFVCLYD